MFEVRDKPEMVERALLVRICNDKREVDEDASLLEELGELVSTLGIGIAESCLLYTSPSPRDRTRSRMPSSA